MDSVADKVKALERKRDKYRAWMKNAENELADLNHEQYLPELRAKYLGKCFLYKEQSGGFTFDYYLLVRDLDSSRATCFAVRYEKYDGRLRTIHLEFKETMNFGYLNKEIKRSEFDKAVAKAMQLTQEAVA